MGEALEITTIFANISTFFGVLVSIVAIIISIRQSKEQYRISQYEYRKKLFLLFKSFQDDWLFYIEIKEKIDPLNIALNGFAKEFTENYLKDDKANGDNLILEITKQYNDQIDMLDELAIYFKLSKDEEKIRINIKKMFTRFYSQILDYYRIHTGDKDGKEAKVIEDMENTLKIIRALLLDSITENLLLKMQNSLKIG